MANGLQDFLGAPDPFEVGDLSAPNPFQTTPIEQQNLSEGLYSPEGPLAYDPMNTGQGPGVAKFSSDEDFKERLLNAQTETDKILTLQATADAGDPNKSSDEKRQGWRETILNMRMMDTYPIPTQQQIMADIKTDMLDMGIDLDAYSKINRSGDAYIAAGNTLTEATRAGYTPLQAISKALGAYGAADRASKLPDPAQVNMAFQLYGMAGDTRKAMLDTRATGLETDTYVVGFPGDESVVTLYERDKKVLNQKGVPWRDAQESDAGGTSMTFRKNQELVTEYLNPYEIAKKRTAGVNMIEATPNNMTSEIAYAGKNGLIEFGTVDDYLVARDLGEDIRMVEDTDIFWAIDDRTGMKVPITNKQWIKEYNKSVKDPDYNMKFFPADDDKSTIPEISFSSSPEGGVEFRSGPASSPGQGLAIGEITNENQAIAATKAQEELITEKVTAAFEAAKIKASGIEQTAEIGLKLLNGLEGTQKGGTGQRIVKRVTGLGTAVQDTVDFFTTQTANKAYVTKFQDAFLNSKNLTGENTLGNTPDDPDTINVSGAWDQVKLTENSPLWKSLKQIGLTDLQEMNTLAFNLAIAELRAQGIDGKLITDKKILMQMRALGLGPDTQTNDEAVAGLKTFLTNSFSKYDQYKRDFFKAAPMDLGGTKTWVPGPRNIPGGWSTSETTQVNPFVHKNYARVESVADDGTTIYESTGVVPFFDTNPVKERLGIKTKIPGETEKVTVRVGDDPSLVNAHFSKPQYQTTFIRAPLMKPTVETTVLNQPLTIPLDLQNWGDMAISYTNQINAASERAKNDGLQPGTQAYANRMGKAENSFYTQYAVGYFGEAAAIDAPSPEREAFSQWIKYVRTFK